MCHSVNVTGEPMLWSGWGDPARARELPEQVRKLLHDLLGVRDPATPRRHS
ncbi:hypothetical protein GCM10020001_015490 [Nonomuraea salmonea]